MRSFGLSGRRDEITSKLRKEENEQMFAQRRTRFLQRFSGAQEEPEEEEDQIVLTIDDIREGTAQDKVIKAKRGKLVQALASGNMPALLESVRYFRRRLQLAAREPLIYDQFRQLDLLESLVTIVGWYSNLNSENKHVIEEATWALINYCCADESAVLQLEPLGFFHLVLRVIDETEDQTILDNVVI